MRSLASVKTNLPMLPLLGLACVLKVTCAENCPHFAY